MNEYNIILNIINEVIEGRNLTISFNNNLESLSEEKLNIGRIKDVSYGTIRNYYALKIILSKLIMKDITDQRVEVIILIALYEILHTRKPVFAITDALVSLTWQITKQEKIKNFVNAVLRNFLRKQKEIISEVSSILQYKLNFPDWMVKKLNQQYGSKSMAIQDALNKKPCFGIRVNSKKISQTKYIEELKQNSIEYVIYKNKIVLENTIAIKDIPLFQEGYITIQDIAAQKILDISTFNTGENILDACSAPGGKACAILENHDVNILCLDVDSDRLDKVAQNLQRLELNANLKIGDATTLDWWDGKLFDKVIADVPCSATGTIKRNPDIKLTRQDKDIGQFVSLQRKIVMNLWDTLKVGGQLIYITCSILKEENQDNINYFAKNLAKVKKSAEYAILPTKYNDGFYYCILEKTI